MPAYHVERSIRIAAPKANVRPAVEDFAQWPKWSPWLCMEPDTQLNYHGNAGEPGHGYEWDGELVGAGKMKLVSNDGSQLKMDLEFLRPFKSTADVMMELKPVGEDETEVTWHMDSKLPFFMFWMVGMMKVWIGMDYARGLKMLKEYVETGNVLSQTDIVGVVDAPQVHYVGVRTECSMDEIGDSMKQTMPAAHQMATDLGVELVYPPGALYHNVDMKQQKCSYSAIMQTKSPTSVDGATVANAHSGSIVPCKAIKVVHTGSYQNLGNSWSAAMAYQRYKKLKPLKSQCAFELYVSDPCETEEADLITEIYVPIRG